MFGVVSLCSLCVCVRSSFHRFFIITYVLHCLRCFYFVLPSGHWRRKIWPFNFDDQDPLLLARDLLVLGLCGWQNVFHQFRSVFWLASVRSLMALPFSWSRFWWFMIYHVYMIIYDHIWQLTCGHLSPIIPQEMIYINIRIISTSLSSLHFRNNSFVVY